MLILAPKLAKKNLNGLVKVTFLGKIHYNKVKNALI